MEIVDKEWYQTMDGNCIGIVTILTDIGERKSYIGVASGDDEEVDTEYIAHWGTPFLGWKKGY